MDGDGHLRRRQGGEALGIVAARAQRGAHKAEDRRAAGPGQGAAPLMPRQVSVRGGGVDVGEDEMPAYAPCPAAATSRAKAAIPARIPAPASTFIPRAPSQAEP